MLIKFKFVLLIAIVLGTGSAEANIIRDTNSEFASQKTDPIDEFWRWFKANEKRLRKFEEDPDKYLSELLEQAKKIQEGIALELEPPKNAVINFTVSADGNKTLFPVVQRIISKAPKIPGWNFIAFRQPMPVASIKDLNLTIEGVTLKPEDMKFYPMIDGDSLDIIIHVRGVTDDNYNQVAYGGLVLLDNLLGEYDCVMKVRNYDFHDMPLKKEELAELQPLLQLKEYIDRFHRKK